MDDSYKYKKRIIINLTILLLLVFGSIFLIIYSADQLSSEWHAILLLFVLLIEFPIIINLSLSGIRLVNLLAESEEKRASSNEEIEKLEQEVEEKAMEAEGLSFNLTRLQEDLGKYSDMKSFGQTLLIAISKQIEIVVGVFYSYNKENEKYLPAADYAYYSDTIPSDFSVGEGLNGQAVKDKRAMFLKELPDGYVKVISGLGTSSPNNLAIIPLKHDGNVVGVIELATFKPIEKGLINRIDDISEFIGNLINKIEQE